jgi:hypothetical protein
VLDIARAAEQEAASKKVSKKAGKQAKAKESKDNEEEDLDIVLSDYDSDCIVVAETRSS